jgi:hypothetical protein
MTHGALHPFCFWLLGLWTTLFVFLALQEIRLRSHAWHDANVALASARPNQPQPGSCYQQSSMQGSLSRSRKFWQERRRDLNS